LSFELTQGLRAGVSPGPVVELWELRRKPLTNKI
jgi:hypothetical protein